MGLLGVWNRTFLNLPTLAVLPYDQRLARLPAYLQQLEMESNGKSVSLDGVHVDFATAPIVWGEPGSNAQHSFFQMLHQGTLTQALDFIAPLRGSWGGTEGQDLALQNCFAQSQAFAFGHTPRGCRGRDAQGRRQRRGNRPHRSAPRARGQSAEFAADVSADHGANTGALLALYEHSVFVQGTSLGREFLRSIRCGIGQEAGRRDRHERARSRRKARAPQDSPP